MSGLPRTAQTIAHTVRALLAATAAGAVRNTYPNGPGTRPVPVALTPDERAAAEIRLADALQEWGDVDPAGRTLWETAFLQDADANPETYATRHHRAATAPAH
ncbi:hypothetical protein [Streptomyces rubiginosohelvolus]|uniref:hypothetical protein n=1 Tax=Streptomyces rubiginosohelvolus TaxID=67362 RepID=UPI003723BDAF